MNDEDSDDLVVQLLTGLTVVCGSKKMADELRAEIAKQLAESMDEVSL